VAGQRHRPRIQFAGSYLGMGNNPIIFGDPDGGRTKPPRGGKPECPDFDKKPPSLLNQIVKKAIQYAPSMSTINSSVNSIANKFKSLDKSEYAYDDDPYIGYKGYKKGTDLADDYSKALNATIFLAPIGEVVGALADLGKSHQDFIDAKYGNQTYGNARSNLFIRMGSYALGKYAGNKIENYMNNKSVPQVITDVINHNNGFTLDAIKDALMKEKKK